ncbi:ABC transporter ATP-binding protein [Metabacillus sp. GX 13764]|uniref:ABC transporter ATP-binding protein n=1 Tax=Metabacillus kandeliae TaxID=2900151 RepID=UPI001E341720|nr:ABC transporter ATP-binding protein [Metabacillus kandeliae]MCD7036723.1 ABC transporter ATP-binding protein [Metabacillus kandeliae]
MAAATLKVQNLTKKIGSKTIVKDVSFEVQNGEIFGLLGPNGAGKTTIIRMIVGLIKRTEGKVMIQSFDLDESYRESMNEIGAIVENPEFYKYMSGYKNLKHYARMSLKNISEEKILEAVRLVKLEKAIHNKVKTYSLGMRQRLGVAQALLHDPSLLILDEPTNGLDPQGMKEFRNYLKELANAGTSVLVSSHLLAEMQLMCDRFAIIEKGVLTHISTMEETAEEGNREVMFTIGEEGMKTALAFLEKREQSVTEAAPNQFVLSLPYEDIPLISKELIELNVRLYEISPVKKSLEDRFLELTREKEGTLA